MAVCACGHKTIKLKSPCGSDSHLHHVPIKRISELKIRQFFMCGGCRRLGNADVSDRLQVYLKQQEELASSLAKLQPARPEFNGYHTKQDYIMKPKMWFPEVHTKI